MGKHYVPKFYLRGFAPADRFSIFDKIDQRWFYSQPKSVAHEVDLWPDELETFVTESIEEPAKDVIDRLRNKLSVTEPDRYVLARYIAFLWKRVPAGRDRVRGHTPLVAETVRKELNVELDEMAREDKTLVSLVERRRAEINAYIEQIKLEKPTALWHGSLKVESSLNVGEGIAGMTWQVLHTVEPRYLTSDNPVFFFQNDGVGNVTSELTLPLSSTATLIGIRHSRELPLHGMAKEPLVREINRRTVSNATRYIFSERVEPWMNTFLLKSDHKLIRGLFHPSVR